MEWVKVPDSVLSGGADFATLHVYMCHDKMPFPEEENVFCTVEQDAIRRVVYPCRFNLRLGIWEHCSSDWRGTTPPAWRPIDGVVTHWMPYPEPAES